MANTFRRTDEFKGGRIHLSDVSGLVVRDCDVSGLRVVDSYGDEVSLSGAFDRVVVNDVDVTAYVQAELDRAHPTRTLARDAASVDDFRAAWAAIEAQWLATIDHVRSLPETVHHERVDGEWSFVETQRHLLFASDAWRVRGPRPHDRCRADVGRGAGAADGADGGGAAGD